MVHVYDALKHEYSIYVPVIGSEVVAMRAALAGLLCPFIATAITLNMYSVPGCSPVIFVLVSLPSTVVFIAWPSPLTTIIYLSMSMFPGPCCQDNTIQEEPTLSIMRLSGASGAMCVCVQTNTIIMNIV